MRIPPADAKTSTDTFHQVSQSVWPLSLSPYMSKTSPPVKANAANAIPDAAWIANLVWSCGVAKDEEVGDAALADPVALAVLVDGVVDELDTFANVS